MLLLLATLCAHADPAGGFRVPGEGEGVLASVRTVAILNPGDEQIGGAVARLSYTSSDAWRVAFESGYTMAFLPGEGVVTQGLGLTSGELSYVWGKDKQPQSFGLVAGGCIGDSRAFTTTPEEALAGSLILVAYQVSSPAVRPTLMSFRSTAGLHIWSPAWTDGWVPVPYIEEQLVALGPRKGVFRFGGEMDLVLFSATPLTLRPLVRMTLKDQLAVDLGMQFPFFWDFSNSTTPTNEYESDQQYFRAAHLLLKVSGW